jgi:hypothetical protein
MGQTPPSPVAFPFRPRPNVTSTAPRRALARRLAPSMQHEATNPRELEVRACRKDGLYR